MKHIIAFSFLLIATSTYGQTPKSDSTIKVIYAEGHQKYKNPAWFINGNFIANPVSILNPKMIEDISIIKRDSTIEGNTYNGQLYIRTKNAYQPALISLTALKNKYTKLGKQAVVFMIDGNIINEDYDKFLVDEDYILQIIVDKIKNEKEGIDLKLLKILTKSEENIKKSKEVKIR